MSKDNKTAATQSLQTELTRKVNVKIVSSKGHDEISVSPQEALDRIREETAKHGKWAYVDGKQVNPIALNVTDILEAEDITLTNALVGG